MKKYFFSSAFRIALIFLVLNGFGQSIPVKYWIPFTNKDNSPYTFENPQEYLSERALARRAKQAIGIDYTDIPVDPVYIDSLKRMGLHIINISKWFNGVIVSVDDSTLLAKLDDISFIDQPIVEVSCRQPTNKKLRENKPIDIYPKGIPVYGRSDNQVTMLNGQYLHQQGYKGENMIIAIEDAGFSNADNVSSLQNVWMSGRVIAQRDFVNDSLSLLETSSHGTIVFSIIAGNSDQMLYGTANQASYALIRTEDIHSECIIEEYNWLCGAEFADSLGADVINTSLGYSTFNDSLQNHSYADLDGKTTPVAIAANIAASRGMLVVVSNGNEGSKKWKKLTSPADAMNILSVGAVSPEGVITSFSSQGPSFDKRIKPDVCAQGTGTIAQTESGLIIESSGTSVAAPVITGLAACLWEANPEASNSQIIQAIQQSSDVFENPDSVYGYGIPNFMKADRILKYLLNPVEQSFVHFNLFPNPARDQFFLEVIRPKNALSLSVKVSYFDIMGRLLQTSKRNIIGYYSILEFNDFITFPTGMYTLQVQFDNHIYSLLFIKNN